MRKSLAVSVMPLLFVSVASVTAIAQDAGVDQNAAIEKLDEGLLDPSWFAGGETLEFHRTRWLDYFWVAEDLNLEGRQLRVEDWEAAVLPPECRKKDLAQEERTRSLVPQFLLDGLEREVKGGPQFSRAEGDVRVVGRFVDLSVPRPYAWKPGYFTFDLKFVDVETNELLVAVHHRMIGDSEMRMKYWFQELGTGVREGLWPVYAGAEVAVGVP